MKTVNSKLLLIAAVSGLTFFGLSSCSKSSGGGGGGNTGPKPINGYVSSDSVNPANLISYWPMDGDLSDKKGGITTTPVNVTFVTGIKGQAYQGGANSYASFTPSTAMLALQSYSLSLWYWQPAQPVGTPNTPQGIFFLADAGGANPDMIVENEHYAPVSGDSLLIHAGFTNPGGAPTAYHQFNMSTFDTVAIGKWVHFCMTYDGGSSTYVVYQNGQAMLNQSAFGTLTSTPMLNGDPAGTPAPSPLGNIDFSSNPPVSGTIGTWAPGVYGVSPTLGSNGNWMGKLDEIRLYKSALTSKEVASLYLLGLAGQ